MKYIGVVLIMSIGPILFGCMKKSNPRKLESSVVVTSNKDGSYLLISTARASVNAIQEGSTAMKVSTACQAARDQIQAKILQMTDIEDVSNRIVSIKSREIIGRAEYCRISVELR